MRTSEGASDLAHGNCVAAALAGLAAVPLVTPNEPATALVRWGFTDLRRFQQGLAFMPPGIDTTVKY